MEDTWAERAGLSATLTEVLEGAADAIVAADTTGRIVLWNDAAEELFGYARASMLGGTVSQLIPERYLGEYEKGVAAAFAAGRPAVSHLRTVARAADGTEYPVEAAVSIAGAGSEAIAVGFVRKIGERFRKLAQLRDSERRLREAEALVGIGSFEWNVGSDEISWSDQLARIFGYEPGDHPKNLAEFLERVHPGDREGLQNNINNALATGSAWSVDERIVRADTGEERVLSSRVKALKAQGRVVRLVGICQDVTEQRRAEEALHESESRFRRVFEDAPIGMLLADSVGDDARIVRANGALARLLGFSSAELSQRRLSGVVEPADRPLVRALLNRAAVERSGAALEVRLKAQDGSTKTVLAAASSMGEGERHASGSGLIVHFEDITLRKHAEEQLRHRALHDGLTGLPNRDLLLDRLEGALGRARRARTKVGVIFLNLDNFKIVNDAVGHVAGDDILRKVAERLTASARGGDTVARVGGDEFVVVCDSVQHDDELLAFARRAAAAISAPFPINGRETAVTVSIGIALGGEPGAHERLLRDADLAMYHAKQRGKNAIAAFDESFRRRAIDRVELEHDLRRGLQAGEIVPYYQPIVELATGSIAGFEALARWRHPERGVLLPAAFLSVAEESHLIGRLGETMLEQACAQLAQWHQDLPNLTMAVNLSALQIDSGLKTIVAQVVEQCAYPRSLFIEVTESVFLEMKPSAAAHLNALARLGVQLGIDDFGTGYSSLLYLKRFPVRFLKIDRLFVKGLPANQEDAAIVEAIVRLGSSLELATIAEGVETKEQLDALRALGCTRAQGYYIAAPKPAHEVALTA